MRESWLRGLNIVVYIAALVPLVLLAWDFAQGRLTANPIREVQLRTGRYTLTLLALSLACTPVYRVSGFKVVLSFRRTLGLYAFGYASLHFINFIGVDYALNFARIGQDIFDKPYALVGFIAYLSLLPLVVTSTRGWKERLGKSWKLLHRLVYITALLGVLHLVWSVKVVKASAGLPVIFGAAVIFLLLLRIPWVARAITRQKAGAKNNITAL